MNRRDLKAVRALFLDPELEVNWMEAELQRTPFFRACSRGLTSIVRAFQEDQRTNVEQLCNRCTPFYIACQNDNLEVVKLLLDDPRVNVNRVADSGITPLGIAACKGSMALIRHLLASARDLDISVKWRNTDAIVSSQSYGHHAVADILSQYLDDPDGTRRHLLQVLGQGGLRLSFFSFPAANPHAHSSF